MRKMLRFFLTSLFLVSCLCSVSHAAQADHSDSVFSAEGFSSPQRIYDAKRSTYSSASGSGHVTISREDGISSLYIEFDRLPPVWTLTDPASGASVTCGEYTFLHEFVDVSALFGTSPKELQLTFPSGTVISDIYAFSAGELPDSKAYSGNSLNGKM